jgi:hypothetical protein
MTDHTLATLEPDVDDGPGTRRRASWWRDRDPVVLVVALVAFLLYLLHGLHGELTRDLAVYSYAGQQVADGVPPYLEVLNRAGPLAHAIPAIGVGVARLGGFDDVVTMRVLFLLLATACTSAVYVLGRDLYARRLGGLVSAAVFLGFHGFIQYASNGPREKTPMTLFVVLTLWAVTHRRWFTAGVFVSLATLCLQIAFFPSMAATVVGALLLARGSRLRALARVALGGAVPVAVLVVWFALAGSLGQSVDGFVLINARYTVPNPLLENFASLREDALRVYGAVWVGLFLGGIVLLALGAVLSRSPAWRRRQPSVVVMPALAAGVAVGLLWDLRDYDSWADLFPLLPFAAVGVGSLVPLLSDLLAPRALRVVTAAASVAAVAVSAHWAVTTRSDVLDDQRRAVDAVLDQLPDDATVTSIEAPQPLVLTGRTNPTRHQMFRAGLEDYVDDTWPGGLDGFGRDLVDNRPTLVAMGDSTYDYWRDAITPAYVCVGTAPDWSWWAEASLGEAKITALRAATGYTSPDDCARYAAARSEQ